MKAKPKFEAKTATIDEVVQDATAEVQDLLVEVESWAQGMEGTNLESSQKYETLQEALEELGRVGDELEGVDIPEEIAELEVTWHERRTTKSTHISRAMRAGDASSMLEAAAEAVEEIEGANDLHDTLQEAANDLGNIEFPGMYG